MILLCGRYEGVDQRVIDASGAQEISVGDYVLSGGELPAMVLLDAVIRLLPGVMGAADSAARRVSPPACWNTRITPGRPNGAGAPCRPFCCPATTPPSRAWRQAEAEAVTRDRRPDLWAASARTERVPRGGLRRDRNHDAREGPIS